MENAVKLGLRNYCLAIVATCAAAFMPLGAVEAEEQATQDRIIQFYSEHPEIAVLDLHNPEILDLVEERLPGIEFYLPALQKFSELAVPEQERLLRFISSDFETRDDTLLNELRLPAVLRDAVLAEAQENGADLEWDMPAFEEALEELRTTGDTGAATFEDIVALAPLSTNLIALQVSITRSQGRLEAAQGRLEAVQGRLRSIEAAIESGNEVITHLKGAGQ